ncbi:MAG: CbtA family protein [Rhodospirillales bacterium]
MVGNLLLRGMLAGLIAGLLAFCLAWYLGEPQVDRAIQFEEHAAMAEHAAEHAEEVAGGAAVHDHGDDEEELVSRGVQGTIGLLTGVVVYGIGLGGLFSLVFAYAYGRVGSLEARSLALLLAIGAFFVVYWVPSLKYPANPPAVGQPETIGIRTGLFFTMVLFSLVAAAIAVSLGKHWVARHGRWNGTIGAIVLFMVLVAVAQMFLPDINEVPSDFPAVTLWRFRIASWSTQVLLWGGIGLIFGYLAERLLKQSPRVAHGTLARQT